MRCSGGVYRAHDTRRQRTVALKRLPAGSADEPSLRARFRRESELASRLRDPHVVPIHDFGEIDDRLFIDMRLVEGTDLADLIARNGRLRPDRAVALVGQLASALDAAHVAGLVHRDVKPSNVLVTAGPDGADFAYLIDFGIARPLRDDGAAALTGTGLAVGTMAYMAPERFAGGRCDHRVDVYALSCVLYECLTGVRPFPTADLPALVYAHLQAPPPAPSARSPVGPAMDAVVGGGMAKDPDARPASAGALAGGARRALSAPADPAAARPVTRPSAPGVPEPRRRPGRRAVVAVVAVGVVVAAAVTLTAVVVADRTPDAPADPTLARIAVGDAPVDVLVSPDGRRAYVSNAGSGTVSVLDTASGALAATVPVVDQDDIVEQTVSLGDLAISPDGRRVLVGGRGTVEVIDTTRDAVSGSLAARADVESVAVAPDGRRAWVTVAGGVVQSFGLDGTDGGPAVTVGRGPEGVAFAPDGSRAYVANSGSDTVSVIDTATGVVTPVPVPAGPVDVAVSPDGSRVYVSCFDAGSVVVIDAASGRVGAAIPVGMWPSRITVSPDGSLVAVTANTDSDSITLIDTAGYAVRSVPVGGDPSGIAFSPDGRRAYLANGGDDSVQVIDVALL